MKVLIVAATESEITPLLEGFRFQWNINKRLRKYLYKSTHVDVLITGAGMVSTSYWMGKTLSDNRYNYAFNFGICGSFYRDLELGQLVNVSNDSFSELGAESGDEFLDALSIDLEVGAPLDQGELVSDIKWNRGIIDELPKVKGITVNTVHGSDESIARIVKRVNPTVESMEGAAFMYGCISAELDFLQIRAISNYVERRDKSGWNIPLAIENLNKIALKLVDSL
ncbi:MAG: futalosine hydrolase [Flavobacteriales bacterium]|jgi:futalosine hydrolase